jgi:hypothetical protein
MPSKPYSATIFVMGDGFQRRFDKDEQKDWKPADVLQWAHEQEAESVEIARAPYRPRDYRFYVVNPATGKFNRTTRHRMRRIVERTRHLLAESGVKTRAAKSRRVEQAIRENMPGISPGPGPSRDRDRRRGSPGHGPSVNQHRPSTSYPIGALR